MVKILKVFRPEPGRGSVDKSAPFGITNMIPCNHDSPALIPKQAALFEDEKIVFLITRSKNDNTVVYRAKTSGSAFVDNDPIEVYWMGFSRKDPHEVDESKLRDDLSWLEKKIAYGATGHKTDSGNDVYEIKLVAVPHLKSFLKLDGARPRLTGTVGGHECIIIRVYVSAQENMIGLPKVLWVNIHGIDVETGEEIVEKICP